MEAAADAIEIVPLETDGQIAAAFELMAQLRPHLRAGGAAGFVAAVRLQAREGYRLFGATRGGRLVGAAGLRVTRTLGRGPHLFVDDLVTDEAARGQGVGAAFVRWLRAYAAARGLPSVHLDSRDTARGFYERMGFTFHTSIPCRIDAGVVADEG